MIGKFLIVSGAVFWFILLYIAQIYLKDLYNDWRLKRAFKKYEKTNKVHKGKEV